MDNGIFDRMHFSKKLKDLLDEEVAKKFIFAGLEVVYKQYDYWTLYNASNSNAMKTHINLYLITTALASAYIDLFYSQLIHDMQDGAPSYEKMAAAITAWINRIRPVQLLQSVNNEECSLVNASIAITTGLNIKWTGNKNEGNPWDVMRGNNKVNNLLHLLVKRSPCYWHLTPVFELLP
jgi:hypothetical protein